MDEKQVTWTKARLSRDPAGTWIPAGGRISLRIIGLLLVVLLVGDSAFADFMVQPMLLRVTVQPGRQYTRELKLENADPQATETLTLRLAELTQKPDASWTEIQPDDPNLSKAVIRSCKNWLTIPSESIPVRPYQIVPFTLRIDVPAGTRGFFFASIVATTAPRTATLNGVVTPISMLIVVPVILEVQNMPMPRRIELTDVGLDPQPQTEATPAASNVTLDIANNGGSFSRVLPIVRLWGQSEGHWRKMMDLKFPEIAIMPGVKLHVKKDAEQPLASGNYRLEGFVFVDGQRGARVQRDVQFKGDPRIPAGPVRGQAPFTIQPSPLFIEMVPGATRSTSITILNPAEEEVTVTSEIVAPEHMQLASNNRGVKGDDLSCADWVTVTPDKVTLKGHTRRNLSVVARMPKEAGKFPSYYAALRLRLSYADGKSAGMKDAWICLQNKPVTGAPLLGAVVMTVSEASPSRYVVSAAFRNSGETHATSLACQGVLSIVGGGGTGAAVHKRFLMTSEAIGQTGILLPFETRTFSGVLDVSDVPEGDYYVTAVLKWPGSTTDGVQEQRVIHVSAQGGRQVARMTTAGGGPVTIKMNP